jgi:hypothetical protein
VDLSHFEHVAQSRPINVQLGLNPGMMQAMEECGYDCHSESPSIHGLHDSEHYPVKRRDKNDAYVEMEQEFHLCSVLRSDYRQ